MTLASGQSLIFPLVVHQPASLSIWPAVQSFRRGFSTNSGVTMRVQLKRWCVLCMWMLQRRHIGDGCDLASTLCKYDVFVLSGAGVWWLRQGSISSELLMCGGGVLSILLLPFVARFLETIDVYGTCFFMFVVVTVWGSVEMFVV